MPDPSLDFSAITPRAPQGLGGLVRDHFSNGRTFATVGWHGGLLDVSHWGRQHLGAPRFFRGDNESAWVKLFRVCVRLGEQRYYLTLHDTQLFPFGYASRCEIAGVEFAHELLLLPDALVQRARVLRNPAGLPVQFEMVHQEACTAIGRDNRTWGEFAFDATVNALLVPCHDRNPPADRRGEEGALAQKGMRPRPQDAEDVTTWIGVGCDAPLNVRRGYHRRSKYYLASQPIQGSDAAYFVAFAPDEARLRERLDRLRRSVHSECDALCRGYEERLQARPRIDVGDPLLNSAFGQYPELIQANKLADRPGAVRATASGYFVWGWDGMTPIIPCAFANEPEYAAAILRFMQETFDSECGIPHAYTSSFGLFHKGPFPAQMQFVASLYHYVATTGDLSVAREVWPTCLALLERCRQDRVGDTGLVCAYALWPDFPEAMEETGDDVSSMNNSLLYQGLRCLEYLAAVLGEPALAAECRDWTRRLRASFVQYLYDEAHGYFISSCDSRTLAPRRHYCCQAIYWITPFARELVAHAPGRIADFMQQHLRTDKCLLSLPHWDSAWMADGNQLGSSFPTADYFYLNVHKLVGEPRALASWLDDVAWFWRHHTCPEAFTPEAENEAGLGPDNPGCKQTQAITCWYAGLYAGMAGLDVDHEGLTITPWGDCPLDIRGLKLRGVSLDLRIRGRGPHVGSLKLNGQVLPAGTRKLAWDQLRGPAASLELERAEEAPAHPVVLRADGLRLAGVTTAPGRLALRLSGRMSGELVVQVAAGAQVRCGGRALAGVREPATGSVSIPYLAGGELDIEVVNP